MAYAKVAHQRRLWLSLVLFALPLLAGAGTVAATLTPGAPSASSSATALVAAAATEPGARVCAQRVLEQYAVWPAAPTATAAAHQDSPAAVFRLSDDTCRACGRESYCPVSLSGDDDGVEYGRFAQRWRWHCVTDGVIRGLRVPSVGTQETVLRVQLCRRRTSPGLVLSIVLPAVAAGVACGVLTACRLTHRLPCARAQKLPAPCNDEAAQMAPEGAAAEAEVQKTDGAATQNNRRSI